jgi:CRP-like cAMP-binding protein
MMRRILIHDVRRGRHLLLPGDTPTFVSVVRSGAVKTVIPCGVRHGRKPKGLADRPTDGTRRPLTVQFGKPGHIVGLAPIAARTASRKFGAVAHCDSTVAEVARDVIVDVLAHSDPRVRLRMIAYHTRAVSRLIAEKCRLLSLSTAGRLQCVLTQLARDFPRIGHPGAINLEIRHRDLADYVGAARTGIVRAMKVLRDTVWLDRQQRCYVVAENVMTTAEPWFPVPSAVRGFHGGERARSVFQRALQRAVLRVGLPRAAANVLLEGAEIRCYEPGDVIGAEDRIHASILVSGAARVLVRVGPCRDVGVWIAKPGHFIGAGWTSEERDRIPAFHAVAHDAGTDEPCRVAVLDEPLMLRVLETLSPSQLLVLLAYCHDALCRQLHDRTVMLPLGNSERLLYQLHVLAADFPRAMPEGTVIDLPLNLRRDLAPLVATDPTGITRAKDDLEAAGRIKFLDDGRVVVLGYHLTRPAA